MLTTVVVGWAPATLDALVLIFVAMLSACPQTEAEQLHWLSFFALNGAESREEARDAVSLMPEQAFEALLQLADLHHVLLRIFAFVSDHQEFLSGQLAERQLRNCRTVTVAAAICEALEQDGCPAMAIKSTDHWPDVGNDFDLFTTGEPERVHRVMRGEFHAEATAQNWGDRLANKWNFRVPDLKPLIEIHIGRLGQTGELKRYGEELIERRQQKVFGDTPLWVPAREDQVILATLQRLYRHYFYRVCDFADLRDVVPTLDFEDLRLIAKRHGVWQGVATHLRVVSEYITHYTDDPCLLSARVRKSARFGIERLYPHAGYLRLPLFPQGATLWGHQVIKTWHRRNRSGVLRLGLVPPLAAAASAAYKVTGKQRIW